MTDTTTEEEETPSNLPPGEALPVQKVEDLLLGLSRGEPTSSRPQIFVSYKVTPDERIATALKRLIETSIDPQPNVFVSGVGGLRSSNVGAIPQMQRAAMSVSAFVGLITKASKDREWMFFEAGAAWGRDVLYAPVLIDSSFDDLPNTLGGYQATLASDAERMKLLIADLASAVGGSLKSRFSTRYATFERVLRSYPNGDSDETEEGVDELERATRLLASGRYEDAKEVFAVLEKTDDASQRLAAKLAQIVNDSRLKDGQRFSALENLETEGDGDAGYLFWRALAESSSSSKVDYLRRCLAAGATGWMRRFATDGLAEELVALSRLDEAVGVLWSAIHGSSRAGRVAALSRLSRISEHADPITKLLLACAGAASASPDEVSDLIRAVAAASRSLGWSALTLYLARRLSRVSGDGASANNEGIALSALGLKSLAYMAYERSAAAGVGVAKVNMASLVSEADVPAAGLVLLDRHIGSFDAASPGYPHRTRGALEDRVQEERTRAEGFASAGKRLFDVIADFARHTVTRDTPVAGPERAYRLEDIRYLAATVPSDDYWFWSAEKGFMLVRARPFENVWLLRRAEWVGVYVLTAEGKLDGLRIEGSGDSVTSTWDTIEPIPAEASQ